MDVTGRAFKAEDIARLAYSYWEDCGYQGGSAKEDWLLAEEELGTITEKERS